MAGHVTGAKGAAAGVLFDMDQAPGDHIQREALRIVGGDHPLGASHPVRKSLDYLNPDGADSATGQAGLK
ncbi:hypothetical protein GCM10027038_15030 [Arthrobacter bambusae]